MARVFAIKVQIGAGRRDRGTNSMATRKLSRCRNWFEADGAASRYKLSQSHLFVMVHKVGKGRCAYPGLRPR